MNTAEPTSLAKGRNETIHRKKPTKVIGLIVTVVVLGLGWVIWTRTHPQTASKMITAVVSRGDLIETVSATGSITAQTGAEVHIGSQVSGTIKRLTTDVGKQVKAGQIIAELDLPDLKAQLAQSQAALAQAKTKYAQQISGIAPEKMQTLSALAVAEQGVLSADEKLSVARANALLQETQTPSDIRKAQTALSTAKSTLVQVNAGANLQVETANETIAQTSANARNSAANLERVHSLYLQGFSSAADYDTAKAQDGVYQSQVRAAQKNLDLVKQKVTADIQAATDAVASAQAVLEAAKAESHTVVARQADVRDAMAAVKQAQANLDLARANRTNDTLKLQDVLTAKQAVDQAAAQVAFTQAQLNKSIIRCPISGTVLQLAAQQGETVSAGLATQTMLIVADLDRLEIDSYVDETDIGKVMLGQSAQCTVDAFPGRNFKGKVTKIASGSTIQQGVVTYDVTISLSNATHDLKPDMTASVSIQTGRVTDAILVPAVALQMNTRGSSVNVIKIVDGHPTTVSVPVVTGGTDGVSIEIRSGIQVGDTIVLAGATSTSSNRAASSPFSAQPRGGGGGGGPRG